MSTPRAPPPPPTPGAAFSRRRASDEYLLWMVTTTSYAGAVAGLRALSFLPRFDASGSVFGRWDAVHFFSVAERGYAFEQQAAFQPGWHALLHLGARAVAFARALGFAPAAPAAPGAVCGSGCLWAEGAAAATGDTELAAVMLNLLLRIAACLALYRLTCVTFNRKTAMAAGLLYAYPPSPAAMLTYTEPGFAAAYFAGLLACARRRWLRAALFFAAATSLRATGVFAAPVLGWALLFSSPSPAPAARPFRAYAADALRHPTRSAARAAYAALLAAIVAYPFAMFNAYLWAVACPGRAWCERALPLAYTAVQEAYWNIGMFRYWTPAQVPNLLIALPVLVPTFAGAWAYFFGRTLSLHSGRAHAAAPLASVGATATATTSAHDVRMGAKIEEVTDVPVKQVEVKDEGGEPVARGPLLDAVYALSVFLALMLVFTSHTQIALRLAVTDPTLWWTLAANAGMRRAWVWWCFLWAAVGLALWSGHYPPA